MDTTTLERLRAKLHHLQARHAKPFDDFFEDHTTRTHVVARGLIVVDRFDCERHGNIHRLNGQRLVLLRSILMVKDGDELPARPCQWMAQQRDGCEDITTGKRWWSAGCTGGREGQHAGPPDGSPQAAAWTRYIDDAEVLRRFEEDDIIEGAATLITSCARDLRTGARALETDAANLRAELYFSRT